LAQKVDSELALRMSFGSEFHTFGAATQNARLAVSVRVTAQRDAEHQWTAETSSSLGVVGVRRCTAERKSTDDRYFVLDVLLDRQPVKRL